MNWTDKVSLIVTLLQSSIFSGQGLSFLSAAIKGTESTHENKGIKLERNDNGQKKASLGGRFACYLHRETQ